MAKHGKKYVKALEKFDRQKKYTLDESLELIKQIHYVKFDETVNMAVRLGVDPRKSEEMIRGAVVLPAGTGKKVRVLVFARGDKAKEAEAAGADFVGAEDIVEKIQGGWFEFDKAIATPDMMGMVGKVGRLLGPRGLMPNPKVGTVTQDITKAVRDNKAGQVEYRTEKAGIIHTPIGKVSFSKEDLKRNAMAVLEVLQKAKPASAKGTYFKSWALSTTMSPGVRLDPTTIVDLLKEAV